MRERCAAVGGGRELGREGCGRRVAAVGGKGAEEARGWGLRNGR